MAQQAVEGGEVGAGGEVEAERGDSDLPIDADSVGVGAREIVEVIHACIANGSGGTWSGAYWRERLVITGAGDADDLPGGGGSGIDGDVYF